MMLNSFEIFLKGISRNKVCKKAIRTSQCQVMLYYFYAVRCFGRRKPNVIVITNIYNGTYMRIPFCYRFPSSYFLFIFEGGEPLRAH